MITFYQTHSHSANAIILTSSVKAELINTHGRGTAEISWLLFLQIKREFEGHGRGVGKSSTSDVYLVILLLPTSWWATRGDSNNTVRWYIWCVHALWRQSFNWLRMQRLGSAGINGVERIFTTTMYHSIAVWHWQAGWKVSQTVLFGFDGQHSQYGDQPSQHEAETAQPLKSDIGVTSRIGGLVWIGLIWERGPTANRQCGY